MKSSSTICFNNAADKSWREREQQMQLISTTTVFKSNEVWKNHSDEAKHRQTPTQTHHTKPGARDDQPSGYQLTLCHRLHTVHDSWKEHVPQVMSCQVLLSSWVLSPRSSCPNNLPSTRSQEKSQLPTELHSWAIIINSWPSIINALKICLHSKYRDTSNKVFPERQGLG